MKLAIDFGTTNTVVAQWHEGVRLLRFPGLSITTGQSQSYIPSLVYVHDGRNRNCVIGQAAREQQLDLRHDNRLFRNFKRGIVGPASAEPRYIDGQAWSDRDAGEVFLRSLIQTLPKDRIEHLVLTAPVAAFESYLSWLGEAMDDLASEQLYIVDESTAAALGYAVTEPGAPVLVFDFGGGTLDLSLVQLPESRETTGGFLDRLRRGRPTNNIARVIAKAGRVIGGSDIDHWLLGWVLERTGLSAEDLGSSYPALLTGCEQAKIELSALEETIIQFEAAGQKHHLSVKRSDLEALLTQHGFYDALRHIVDKVMHVAHRQGIFREDVKYVLLVGGVSLMPSVQAALRDYFGDSAVRADKPFTAVAEGALQVAAGYGLDDYLSQSYGLRYLDTETGKHLYDEIIPMGSRYPSGRAIEIELGAAHQGQVAMEFIVGEIGVESGNMLEVRYEGGQTIFVAQAQVTGAQVQPLNEHNALKVTLTPPAIPGKKRLRAYFSVDKTRHLKLSVTDVATRRELVKDVVIATLGNISEEFRGTSDAVTGYEPLLINQPNGRRLTLRGVATMLNMLSPDAISLPAAEAALRSSAFGTRYNAAVALSKRGDRDARHVMHRVLSDGDAPARASVARHLNGFTWYAAEPLIRQALADTDSRVREAAMYALCALRELNAYHLMTEVLQNEEDNVREAAAYGLRDCQDPAVVPVLQAVLLAKDPDVRVKALEALSNNDTPQALTVVRSALEDTNPRVIYAATLSLLELAREDVLEEISIMIRNTQSVVRETILRAFFHATNYLNINPASYPECDALLESLAHALQDRLSAARKAAFWPLAWMRHERANDLLMQAYHAEKNSEVKAHLVRVVVALMSPVAETILQSALACPEPQVKHAAEWIVSMRARAGVILQYDESAPYGTGLAKPGSDKL